AQTASAGIHRSIGTCVRLPEGEAAPRATTSPATTARTAVQPARDSPPRSRTVPMTRASGSSITSSGWTTVSGPVASATAWQTAAAITAAMPASQTGRRSRSSMSPARRVSDRGTVRAALRWRTVASALLKAAASANTTGTRMLTAVPRNTGMTSAARPRVPWGRAARPAASAPGRRDGPPDGPRGRSALRFLGRGVGLAQAAVDEAGPGLGAVAAGHVVPYDGLDRVLGRTDPGQDHHLHHQFRVQADA